MFTKDNNGTWDWRKKGRGLKIQMCLEPQVPFFFFDYTNDYLQTVDTY